MDRSAYRFLDKISVGINFLERLLALFFEHHPILNAVIALVAYVFGANRILCDLQQWETHNRGDEEKTYE